MSSGGGNVSLEGYVEFWCRRDDGRGRAMLISGWPGHYRLVRSFVVEVASSRLENKETDDDPHEWESCLFH